jgi:hypothetical protein
MRLRSIFACSIFVVLFGIGSAALAQDTEGVLIFNGKDGTGLAQAIPVGDFQVDGKQLGSNQVSVKVSKGYVVKFCPNKDGSGTCEEFGEGTHNLTSVDFNFIGVKKGQVGAAAAASTVAAVTVFEQPNWAGRSQVFQPGMYRSFRGEFGQIANDHAMSIIVAKGYHVRLCVDEGHNYRGAGDCEEYGEGRRNLRFGDSISFIEVKDLSDTSPDDEKMPVVLYEEASQVGKIQGFDVGAFSAARGEFKKMPNDQASSIWVKDGYRAVVCADDPTGTASDNCEEFGAGKKNLKGKKTASYLKVTKDSK